MSISRHFCLLLALLISPTSIAQPFPLAASVNTLIGTLDDGNTFPGASAPFGRIQLSPLGEHYAGWRYDEKKIYGLGHSFISGGGCWQHGADCGGQVSVLPVTGTIAPGGDFDTRNTNSFDHRRYGARYTHEGEIAQAGYYKVRLLDYGGIDMEATALPRAAAERYTFSRDQTSGHILVNVAQANSKNRVRGSRIEIVGDNAVEGSITVLGHRDGHEYTTWFRIEFDRAFTDSGIWSQAGANLGARMNMENQYTPHNGAWFTFDLNDHKSVTAISAISHVDIEGARHNLRMEAMQNGQLLSFDAMRTRAQSEWERELATVIAVMMTRYTRPMAGHITSIFRCGIPTAARTSYWPCSARGAHAISGARYWR